MTEALEAYQTRERIPSSQARAAWIAQLEVTTQPAREARASSHDRKAREAAVRAEEFRRLGRNEPEDGPETIPGASPEEMTRIWSSRAQWHRRRAAGLRRRFERLEECGLQALARVPICGHEHAQIVSDSCQEWRICMQCRNERQERYRGRFQYSRAARMDRAPWRAMGYRERFLTLTVPHGDLQRAQTTLRAAWGYLRRRMKQYFGARDWAHVAVLEHTPGQDNLGHPHLHVWLHSPYLPHELIRHWYGSRVPDCPTRTLEEVLEPYAKGHWRRSRLLDHLVTQYGDRGRPLERVNWPVVDIREWQPDDAAELFKYTLKDATRQGEGLVYVDAEGFAKIYAALLGRRTVTTSKHFWVENEDHESFACPDCGVMSCKLQRFLWSEVMAGTATLSTQLAAAIMARQQSTDRPPTG